MASERRLKAGVLAALAGLLVLAAGAGAFHESPRLVVACALAALPLAGLLWHGLAGLSSRSAVRAELRDPVPMDRQNLVDNALVLEARLEHAPIALFGVGMAGLAGEVSPLNANARRLVAPGRASDPAALYRQLAAQPVDQRGMIGFDTERGIERALVSVSALTLQGSAQRLAALMPVESELEAEALNAWRQLVHVLTHEIMNSLTPVASLSRTAYSLLDEFRAALPPMSAPTWSPRSTPSAGAPTAWSLSSAATAACRICPKRVPSGCAWSTCSNGSRRWSTRSGARAADARVLRSNRNRWS
jgi:hypothetical protein